MSLLLTFYGCSMGQGNEIILDSQKGSSNTGEAALMIPQANGTSEIRFLSLLYADILVPLGNNAKFACSRSIPT